MKELIGVDFAAPKSSETLKNNVDRINEVILWNHIK